MWGFLPVLWVEGRLVLSRGLMWGTHSFPVAWYMSGHPWGNSSSPWGRPASGWFWGEKGVEWCWVHRPGKLCLHLSYYQKPLNLERSGGQEVQGTNICTFPHFRYVNGAERWRSQRVNRTSVFLWSLPGSCGPAFSKVPKDLEAGAPLALLFCRGLG